MAAAEIRRVLFLFLIVVAVAVPFADARAAERRWNCPKDPKALAGEMLELALSGAFHPVKSPCLEQRRFKQVLVVHDPSSEAAAEPPLVLAEAGSARVKDVVPRNEHGEYIVTFTTTLPAHQDSFVFVAHSSARKQKLRGCASFLIPPQKTVIRARCAPKS